MKKQYRYGDYLSFGKKYLTTYHDGELIETKVFWLDDFFDEKDRLEDAGYTYAFSKEEVEKAKERYEYMLANMIEEKMTDDHEN